MKFVFALFIILTVAAPACADFTLSVQFKPEICADQTKQPTESAYWQPCFVQTARVIQQMNLLFADQLINGPLKSNPGSTTVEGFIGDVNTPANEAGVVTAVFGNYRALKIPYLPPSYLAPTGEVDTDGTPLTAPAPLPFVIYLGDTSEQIQRGVDEEGKPVYETVYGGSLL